MNSVRAGVAAAGILVAAAACGATGKPRPEETVVPNQTPVKGSTQADFRADAVYTDDHGGIVGVRWVHEVTAMPVVVLRIQSVPQVFLAFNTPPVSDRGEPHTGEHLLLGKGTKGKTLSLEQDMSLVESTAWTSQTDVCYSWGCAAGKETFYRSVEQYLDALLLPDYTDEEIRREVCHIGPVKDEATGKLSVDEKGTIYQEMVSTYEKRWNVWWQMQKRLWGEGHPLAFSSGGEPSAVRTCEPRHVHEFHAAHYHLGADTEMIVSLPESIPEAEFLAKLSAQMAAVGANPALAARGRETHPIPPGRPQADKSLKVYPYPNANEGDGCSALFAWTPVPLGTQYDRVLAQIFLSTLADGETATLYRRLMDSATREVQVDAAEMGSSLDASKIDLMPAIALDGLPPRNATPERMGEIERVIRDEIARVAALAPGSPDLAAFNAKALIKLTEREKGLRKQLNSPPLFGHRGAGGFWLDHVRLLDQDSGFERSVTLAPVFATLRAEIEKGANPWTHVVRGFGLDAEPYAGVSVPSKAELEKRAAEKAKRVEGYVADIAKGGDAQQALAKFKAEYDATTAEMAEAEKRLPKAHLVSDLPLTPDPSMRLEPIEAGGVKGFRGLFDNMTFTETSLSFRVDATAEELPWLAILPQFLTESGVVIDGKPVPYDEASERRSKEIYSLSASWSMRPSKARHELRITASGAELDESQRAIDWLDLCLQHAWIAPENLPRLRDLVAQEIQATRGRLGGAEESWVRDPAGAVRWQRDPIFLATSSIHARLFLLARCEWMLMDTPAGADAETVRRQLDVIASLGQSGGDAKAVAAALDTFIGTWQATDAPANAKWVVPIARRIKEMVGDMAPATIAADLKTLTDTCWADLGTGPDRALAACSAFVRSTVSRANARFVLTGSRAHTDALQPRIVQLVAALPAGRLGDVPLPNPDVRPARATVDDRLREHEGDVASPLFYGLVHGAGSTGVFVLSANAAGLDDLDPATLRAELAGRLFGGAGAHAFFMKTWGAGLAYSNGLGVNPNEGRANYYAERCPDLVQTMTFVTGLVKDAAALDDPFLAEYCVANAVTYSRESDEYESRTRAAADDVVDGDTPGRVARYRRAILTLRRDDPNLWESMKTSVVPMTGRVLPGVGPASRDVPGGLFFTIAPEPMLARWDEYVREHEGGAERVVRVYGRDFWIVPR